MKTAFTLAVLGALATTPAFAQGMSQGGTDQGSMGSSSQGSMGSSSSQMESSQTNPGQQPMGHTGKMHHQAANRETVRNAQQALVDQGYQVGSVDGVMGTRTREAVRDFQKKQGLQSNGQLDQQTLAALGVESNAQQAQTPEERTRRPMTQPTPPTEQAPPSGGTTTQPGGSMTR